VTWLPSFAEYACLRRCEQIGHVGGAHSKSFCYEQSQEIRKKWLSFLDLFFCASTFLENTLFYGLNAILFILVTVYPE